ncbi:iron-sulfur cluster assembly scaffold protein, partial [Chryseobacterium gambrini]|uniref:iron-sulfur cluster assembly scaffold protein n=2 Tax=Bacteria TaxID=2 RepID=UPI0033BE93E1
DGKTVEDVSYDAVGCSISQASTSVMAEEIVGKSLEEANSKLDEFEKMITSRGKEEGDEDVIGDGVAFAGVSKYPARVKCALLG